MIIQRMNSPLHGVAPLPQYGVIRAEGQDAASFLHGQLTQDVALLGVTEARLAAFCSAKGRMQASFVMFKRSPTARKTSWRQRSSACRCLCCAPRPN